MLDRIVKIMGISLKRLVSSCYALPFLLFLIPSTQLAISDPIWLRKVLKISVIAVFAAVYTYVWLTHDPAPVARRTSPKLSVALGVLLALHAGSYLLDAEIAFATATFLVPPTIILLPARKIVQTYLAITATVTPLVVLYLITHEVQNVWWLAFGYFGTSFFLMLVRHSMEQDAEKERRLLTEKQQIAQVERDRMAGDIHDLLGQTLTAISTLSQLTARMIEGGNTDEALHNTQQVTKLSRDALIQMRALVHGSQTLRIEEELAKARLILGSEGIDLRIHQEPADYNPEIHDLLAHIIREGVTNIIHHSCATMCTIDLDCSGIVIENNGLKKDSDCSGGSGIAGLVARTAGLGTLSSGRKGHTWELKFVLNHKAEFTEDT